MDLQLTGKPAVVTGSAAGIGLAIARAVAREGAGVIVNGRAESRVRAATEDVRRAAPGAGAHVSGVAADLGTAAGVAALIARVPATDILVNNLGVYAAKPFSDITDAEWSGIFETNVLSGVRAVGALFAAQVAPAVGRGGRIRPIYMPHLPAAQH